MRYKIEFLGQIDRFSPYFSVKSGRGGLNTDDLSTLFSNINSILRNKHFLFNGS